MTKENRVTASRVLENKAKSLDISDSCYEEAKTRYEAVGKWLQKKLPEYEPKIYPQGSFRLGTVIKPVTDKDDYDIDLVCELQLDKDRVTQRELKHLVGDSLRASSYYEPKLDRKEGTRCWTLNYEDDVNFHMDILPAIPAGGSVVTLMIESSVSRELAEQAIAITDKTLPNYNNYDHDWPHSNPNGYAE